MKKIVSFLSVLYFGTQHCYGWVSSPVKVGPLVLPTQHDMSLARDRKDLSLKMSLVPLPVEELEDLLVVGNPSGPQYATYWGLTKREQYNRFLESAIVTFLGVFFSYFLSFVLGGFMATVFGALFAFWGILSPEFKARQRNWEFLGGRPLVDPWSVEEYDTDKQGLYGALFLGRIDDVCVVEDNFSVEEYNLEDFLDYTMDTDEREQLTGSPYQIRIRLTDTEDRELQIHARMSEDYLDIKRGMPTVSIMLSKSQSFASLAALSDVMVPDADCWVGDYPYLNRPEVEALLADDDDVWDQLLFEGTGDYADDEDQLGDSDEDGDYEEGYSKDDAGLVPVRRRRN